MSSEFCLSVTRSLADQLNDVDETPGHDQKMMNEVQVEDDYQEV